MLSLSNVSSGAAAASYYEAADDYYAGQGSPSAWWGAGAQALGLAGAVDAQAFARLLDGRLPHGELLHHAAAGRRGGTDATFSAPKSVSLQALVGGDARLIEAHRRAVDQALAHAQSLAACRLTVAGKTSSVSAQGLVVARFEHDLSRACDPQLHTHCVIVNATRREDGPWRALDNEPLYRAKMLLGALYRAELARQVQELGYEVRLTHLDGRFELGHISQAQVQAFSQRSAAIEAYLQTTGQARDEASAWHKKLAAVITRDKKTAVDRALLRQQWEQLSQAQAIGYALPEPPGLDASLAADSAAKQTILTEAVAHLGERHAVFTRADVQRQMLERGVGVLTFAETAALLAQAEQCGLLLPGGDGQRYTTEAARQREAEILALEVQGRERLTPIHAGDAAPLRQSLQGLTEEQQQALLGLLLGSHQVQGIQGRAGVGKTTLLASATAAAQERGYQVQGLAPSASAARELAGAGMPAQTIAAFLAREHKGLTARTVLVLDEAGMASSKQMHQVLQAVAEAGCRLILVGDTAQLAAVEAGKPFAQLQANGMATALLGHIQRQRDPALKQAVELAVSGQVSQAVQLLDKQVSQIVAPAERYARIAQDYVALDASEQERTRVVAGTRQARARINQAIRECLGLAGDDERRFTLLARKDLTEAQRRSTLSYQTGEVVQAEIDYPSLGLKRGEFAQVAGQAGHRVLLTREDGAQVGWQPALAHRLGVFTAQPQALAVGDLVRITANDRARGLVNGDLGRVQTLQAHDVGLRMADGRQLWLDGTRPLLLDYGYCSTVHAAQGQTCSRVLIDADAHSLTANRSSFYVAISRARDSAHIYTDDREMLPIAMGREHERQAALELLRGRGMEEAEL